MATLEEAVLVLDGAARRNPSWMYDSTKRTLTFPLAGGLEFRTFHGTGVRWVLRIIDAKLAHAHAGIGLTSAEAFMRLIAHVENIDLVGVVDGEPIDHAEVTRVQGLLPELQACFEAWNS